MKPFLKSVGRALLVPVVFLTLSFLYLYPGTQALIERRTDVVLSDDTDLTTLPYANETLIQIFHERPTDLLFGAVFVDRGSPSCGAASWVTWGERWTTIAFSKLIPIEQLSTVFIYLLLASNGVVMYAFCRTIGWSRSLSYALAIAWAFCAYTLARSRVHTALAGTYHLPLIFLGLNLISRGKTWRSVIGAAFCFLLSTTTAHYLIITAAFLSPFYLVYLGIKREKGSWIRLALRTSGAVFPSVLFLIFCLKFPVPPRVQLSPDKLRPQLAQAPAGELHPFLTRFASRPIDYLTGDVANGALDTNPIRQQLNESVLSQLGDGIAHERAAGIRWIFLLILGLCPLLLFKVRSRNLNCEVAFFTVLGVFALWLSLSPTFFGIPGPSLWLHNLVEQIRVPSRANIFVHFAVLMIAGAVLHTLAHRFSFKNKKLLRLQKFVLLPGVLPALVIFELPPLLQKLPLAPIRPRMESLARERGSCGPGLHFPVTNFDYFEVHHYHFIQQMRGSDCVILNNDQTRGPELAMLNRFPYHPQFFKALNDPIEGPRIADQLEKFARCVPLTWIAFDAATSPAWREDLCRRLGWRLHTDLACTADSLASPLKNSAEECLK